MVEKNTFEVLEVHQRDKVEDDLESEEDHGLHKTWFLYYKLPLDEDINLYHTEHEKDTYVTNELALLLHASATEKIRQKTDVVKQTTLKKLPNSVFKKET